MIYQLKEPQSSESSCSSPSKKKQVENLEPWIGKACLQQTKVVTSYLALLGGVAIQGLWCLCCSCSILQAPSLEPTRNSRFRYTDIGSRMFQVYRSFPTRKMIKMYLSKVFDAWRIRCGEFFNENHTQQNIFHKNNMSHHHYFRTKWLLEKVASCWSSLAIWHPWMAGS